MRLGHVMMSFVVSAFGFSADLQSQAPAYGPAALWSKPIDDYRQQAQPLFGDDFNSGISTLHVFGDQLWMGYGDGNKNLGTPLVIEFRYFEQPENPVPRSAIVRGEMQGEKQRTAYDTGEEQIEPFRVCLGHLCQAGVDSNDHDERWTQALSTPAPIAGNFFRLRSSNGDAIAWEKFRSIPGGEHVHDLAEYQGELYAVGSGAANRDEWNRGNVFRYLWRSQDGGRTFAVYHREVCPEPGKTDTRFRYLLPVGKTLYVFGYINPYVERGPRRAVHQRLEHGQLRSLPVDQFGSLPEQLVVRCWPCSSRGGVVVARDPANEANTWQYELSENSAKRIAENVRGRVIDGCPEDERHWLFLVGDGQTTESFFVYRAALDHLETWERVCELPGLQPNCLAVWHNGLYLGTRDGTIWRSMPQ